MLGIRLNYLAAFVVGALGVSAAGAQNVVFTNSTNSAVTPNTPYTIQLKAGQPVSVAPNGDIRAQCELDGSTGRCVGIPAGTGGTGPIDPNKPTQVAMSTSFTDASTDPGLQIAAGTAFTINASAAGAMACVRSATPSVPAWTGVVDPGAAGAQVSLPSAGTTYTFDFKCLNDAGATSASALIIQAIQGTVVEPPPTGGNCADTGDGFFSPVGLTAGMSQTFTQLWSTGTSPAGQPVGAALTKIEMTGGQYRSFSFNWGMLNGTTDDMQLQMNADTSNTGGRPGADYRYIAISECPNDLRQPNPASPDPLMKPGCRVYATEGPFLYMNFGAPSSDPAICNLDPNKTYYFNVTFDAPFDGFSATQPCNSTRGLSESCGFRVQIQF